MDDALASHPTLKQFIYDKEGVLENLNEQLRSVNGNINKIETLQEYLIQLDLNFLGVLVQLRIL